MVFRLRPGVKFWDGHPVTPADVVYSLDRNTDPKLGGFYGLVFNRVKSITATSPTQVTITLKQPDYWLEVPIVIVFPVAPACWTSFLASAMLWASTGEES